MMPQYQIDIFAELGLYIVSDIRNLCQESGYFL